MRKAREEAKLSQQQMADRIGMKRQTIGNYELGVTPPKRPILLAWALATNVPLPWLTGEGPNGEAVLPRRDSNTEPAGYVFRAQNKIAA